MAKTPFPKRPLTIGFLTPNIAEGNGLLLWSGILEQAQATGARLVTFAGGELRPPQPFYRQASQVYELVDRQQLDGLIVWTSSLMAFIGEAGIDEFCRGFSPLPVVSVGVPLANIPSIILQSYQAMREAILHLVNVHGRKQIVFLRGPVQHRDAQERLRAYTDIVAEYNLDANPDLVSPPCRWLEQDATQAMRFLVEERKVTFDGVVAVSDLLAYGAMSYLQKKGFRLPQDVSLIGFDNTPQARICTPPLTTVPNRMRERGRQAVRMLLAQINGEEVAGLLTLTTCVKIRQSCGCQDPYIVQAGEALPVISLPAGRATAAELRSHVIAQLQRAVTAEIDIPIWPERLFDTLQASLDGQSDVPFLAALLELLQSSAAARVELREWQTILTELRRWVIPLEQAHPARMERAERLLHQGRVMVGEITTRLKAYQEWLRSRQLNDLHRLRQAISATETLDDLVNILVNNLPKLGIAYGYLALYVDSAHPLDGVHLVLAFDKNGRQPVLEGQVFSPATQLVPPEWLDASEALSMMVHPLYFGAEQLGFLLVDSSAVDASGHQVLREQISSAIKNVLLIEQNVKLYQQARQSQEMAENANALKSRFLSMVSHELLTPMVLLVGLSEMMLREEIGNRPPLPEAYRQDLTRIHASAQQLGSLVRDVLDLAQSQLGQLNLVKKPVSLANILSPIELVCEQMARSKGLAWQISFPAPPPLLMADASRLQQVILNLVSNAVKFTAQGAITLTAQEADGMVTVAVTDTGLSVPPAEQAIIFDEFRQSARTVGRGYGGLGIGLAICRQLVELHGGVIGVRSSGEENSGSTFYFSLPVLPLSVSPGVQQLARTVLILTEQPESSLALQQHLERQGFEVGVTNVAQNAGWLEALLVSPPGALVLDFPVSEQGWWVMDLLKKDPATQDIPMIFYSLLQEQDQGSMLALDYLAKPVAAASLAHALRRYISSPDECGDQRKVLIVDDDPEILSFHARLVTERLPACQVLCAQNGREALKIMQSTPPVLVLLDLMMPELDGMGVLQAMQQDRRLQGIPVIILTAQRLSQREMEQLNCAVVSVLSKGVFTASETLVHIEHALARHKGLGSDVQRLVRKAMAYLHENYTRDVSRQELADYAGVSERHLNRCFLQETGLAPLTYLNRYRIQQAKLLLDEGSRTVTEVMGRVGFSESSYFTRMFRREVGISPSEYKKKLRP
ncbi:MAG: substrate-binding domain-containing protein [Chloroflexota bacterium]